MTTQQIVQSLRVKLANIQGECNSGRAIPPAVLKLAMDEIAEMLAELSDKINGPPTQGKDRTNAPLFRDYL